MSSMVHQLELQEFEAHNEKLMALLSLRSQTDSSYRELLEALLQEQ